MRDPVQASVPLVVVVAVALWIGACSDQIQERASGARAADPAQDAGVSGPIPEAAGVAAPASGEEHGGGEGERRDREREHGNREAGYGGHDGEHAGGEAGHGGGENEHGSHESEHGGREGEHGEARERHDHGSEGEESGEYLGPEETWDATRRGARLILSFDPARSAFGGTVENTTQQTLCAVRVEVHLSTETELGPTERTDLAPGESRAVELPAAGEPFAAWTAHPEVSACDR